MAWPVWTTAILPSVNGVMFGPEAASAMHIVKLTTSRPKKSNRLYYWATLRPIDPRAPIGAGRYVVDKAAYERWQLAPTRPAQVVHVEGLLGARIALAFR
ncbi:MAG: hypothetical protein QHC67_15355 [Sphingobium sp.]|uniref:hypothetical protein n=1 Tax=Sphingobium sp. TaxID=1912891 RepID=UPI0029AF4C4A|nr:hypothetical protein [Sphingobium sp.]MDX3911176.1 hypothetical protein [Sphingobium sp.]